MNGEQKFLVSCCGIVGATILGIALLIFMSIKHEDNVKSEMVKEGYSPQEVMCAFPKTASDKVLCANVVMKGDE